jgi:hypothetical protein
MLKLYEFNIFLYIASCFMNTLADIFFNEPAPHEQSSTVTQLIIPSLKLD